MFCGSYSDYARALNFKEMWASAAQLGLTNEVRYLGPVPDEDMAALYTQSVALVMPTFFGPTNIPPLEAWHFGRPVITSDIRGLREQTGDAGLLVDPRSPDALADAMLRLWRDDALCTALAERGRKAPRVLSLGDLRRWRDRHRDGRLRAPAGRPHAEIPRRADDVSHGAGQAFFERAAGRTDALNGKPLC